MFWWVVFSSVSKELTTLITPSLTWKASLLKAILLGIFLMKPLNVGLRMKWRNNYIRPYNFLSLSLQIHFFIQHIRRNDWSDLFYAYQNHLRDKLTGSLYTWCFIKISHWYHCGQRGLFSWNTLYAWILIISLL